MSIDSCKPIRPKFTYRKCVNEKKQEILNIFTKHRRNRPAIFKALTKAELHVAYGNYCSPSAGAYDPIFHQTLINSGDVIMHNKELRKNEVLEFIKNNGRKPARKSRKISKKEKRLGVWLRCYSDKVAYPTMYDATFVRAVKRILSFTEWATKNIKKTAA